MLRGVSRGGRAVRWISPYAIPELYERLRCCPGKSRREAIAQPYFLAGIESRSAFAFYKFFKNLCIGGWDSFLSHMACSAADLMWRPGHSRAISPPPLPAERWLEDKPGFRVKLVGRKHNFCAERVVGDAVEVDSTPPLSYDSIQGKPGSCIFLTI